MRIILAVLAALTLISRCAAQKKDQRTEHYESSIADCNSEGNEIECDWDKVTNDWKQASASTFKSKQNISYVKHDLSIASKIIFLWTSGGCILC